MIISCAITSITAIPGVLKNTINFLGTNREFDSEAEFRLAQLGISIVEAKRTTLDVGISLKTSYTRSIQDSPSRHTYFTQALANATEAKEAWTNVARNFRDTRRWLEGKLREDYCQAFVQAATAADFHTTLTNQGSSIGYMVFAFENVCSICEADVPPTQAVLDCLKQLAEQAERCVEAIDQFTLYLEELQNQEGFSLYRYIFDHLALQAKKPRLYELDEAYFTVQNEFEITYEAVEQISRHAHTLVPGTHDPDIEFFNLRFTE